MDAEPVSGVVSLTQPTLQPLGKTRSLLESLALWSGREATAYELLQANWRETVFPRWKKDDSSATELAHEVVESQPAEAAGESQPVQGSAPPVTRRPAYVASQTGADAFTKFWEQALHDGFISAEPESVSLQPFQADALKTLDPQPAPREFSLVLCTNVAMPDSRHAHNPWLHELPDPVTKVTWGNYVSVSPETAAELDLTRRRRRTCRGG